MVGSEVTFAVGNIQCCLLLVNVFINFSLIIVRSIVTCNMRRYLASKKSMKIDVFM